MATTEICGRELPDTPEVKEQLGAVLVLESELRVAKEELDKRVRAVQDVCRHEEWEKIMGYDGGAYEMDSFLGKKCKKCKLFVPRPKNAMPWEICYRCGGQMEYVGTIPGQGERHRVYKCKDCGKEHSHT